jgi:hypothetical protein
VWTRVLSASNELVVNVLFVFHSSGTIQRLPRISEPPCLVSSTVQEAAGATIADRVDRRHLRTMAADHDFP